jgi:hypothetical protein
MRTYRAYFLDYVAKILRPPEIIECANDYAASQKAKQSTVTLSFGKMHAWSHASIKRNEAAEVGTIHRLDRGSCRLFLDIGSTENPLTKIWHHSMRSSGW